MNVLKVSSLPILYLILISFSNLLSGDSNSHELKVLTYNIWGGGPPLETRLELISQGIADLDPHIIAFQETYQSNDSDESENTATLIANKLKELTGIHWYVAKEIVHRFDTSTMGNAILSKYPVLLRGFHQLPQGEFNRILQWATIEYPFGFIKFYNTHLSYGWQQTARIEQAQRVRELVIKADSTNLHILTILAGDLNDFPDSPPLNIITTDNQGAVLFYDTWREVHPDLPGYTAPTESPSMRIDYVLLKSDDPGAPSILHWSL